MKGLLIKDIRLLLQRKNFFIGMLGVSVMLTITTTDFFIVGYLTLLITLFALSSMSYDEYDNCYAFLLTMPIDRKTYVAEKYIYSVLLGIGGWCTGFLVNILAFALKGKMGMIGVEQIIGTLIFIPLSLLIVDLMLPLQLKFGMERSRTVVFLIGGIGMLIGFGADKLLHGASGIPVDVLQRLNEISALLWFLIFVMIVLLLTVVSYFCSYRIFKKKEF